jgi:DNA polymerase I-like protein with 3'-5' exonuclease and polymerase domains
MYPLECSFDEARDFRDAFYAQYKTLSEYGKTLAEIGEAVGIIVDPFGRNYPIDRAFSYKALNYMVQGSAAGVMKRALINLDNLFQKKWPGTNLLLAIHDEVCIEVPLKYHSKQIMRDIIEAMQGDFHKYFGMPKPFKVSMSWTSKRWSEKKEIEI